jgi:hypothetical protein
MATSNEYDLKVMARAATEATILQQMGRLKSFMGVPHVCTHYYTETQKKFVYIFFGKPKNMYICSSIKHNFLWYLKMPLYFAVFLSVYKKTLKHSF